MQRRDEAGGVARVHSHDGATGLLEGEQQVARAVVVWSGATTVSPGATSDSAAEMAPMPDAWTSAVPPSRSPSADSKAFHVGFPTRA